MSRSVSLVAAILLTITGLRPAAVEPIHYRFSFPEREHHWMQVEVTFTGLAESSTLELRMSRSSPGRYALHDFAKNVYDVHAFAADGRELATTQPDAYGWNVAGHRGSARITYKIYGDRVDGTYLAVDAAHAHINMPAVVMWARGLDDRPATITFEQPTGARWQVATQLYADGSPNDARRPAPNSFSFSAPNLQYLMDSPAEFGPVIFRQFTVGAGAFRFAAHQTGTDAELDSFLADVEKIIRQEGAVFGEFPAYETGRYTFLADYLPYADVDGMEHRNSTVMTSPGSIAYARLDLLGTVAHEFFHGWNVERIRPRDIEPFDLERVNTSSNLWLAEGFTQYYGPLAMERAGLVDAAYLAGTLRTLVEPVVISAGRLMRSAEEMSRMAPFTDGGDTIDRTNWSFSVISYYQQGGAIALALDLTLRDRSNGQVSLDDFMRAMWRRFGKPGGAREGYVDHPYTTADVEATLADVSDDRAFARDFVARYIQGREAADYSRLLALAGFAVRPQNKGFAWMGDVRFESRGGAARVVDLVSPNWPAYAAGLDDRDEVRQLAGQRIASADDVAAVLRRRKPGDRVQIVFVDRDGVTKTGTITLAADPHFDIVPVESTGGALTAAQRAFRDRWLGPKH